MQFIYTTCQIGAEAALKKEILRVHPELRFAFSRPGFITFKYSGKGQLDLNFEVNALFARTWGISLGKATGDIAELVRAARAAAELALPKQKKIRLHVWERDLYASGEEPRDFVPGTWAQAARDALGSAKNSQFLDDPLAQTTETVFDIIVVEKNEWWFGVHKHSAGRSPYPGARPEVELPAQAPSRAYLKIREALLWSQAPLRKGDLALEIGSAPGGASFALLEQGLQVIGVDPGQMDAAVIRHPNFRHISLGVGQIVPDSLPQNISWLLLDMNVEPQVALNSVARLAAALRGSLLGVLLTLKLNDWKLADTIPARLEQVRALGMVEIRATQLPSNRQEFFVYGLTEKGLARKNR